LGTELFAVTVFLLALLVCACIYSLLAVLAGLRYSAAPGPEPGTFSPISILKPLAGADAALESNLRTFFEQDYQAFELLFAVEDADDAAVPIVEKLIRDYPQVPARLLVTGGPTYSNAKVYSLEQLLAAASNDLVVMSDSDTRVGPNLLRTVGAEFEDLSLGLETCPYRAIPGESLWSRMEATGLNTDFMAGILVARMLEGMRFAVGPTIAARRSVLQSIGGFPRLKDYLAEDFLMGKFTASAGYGVALSRYVIEHHIGNSDLKHNAAHRMRWVRSTRRSRPLGYFGQFLTMPLPLALLVCALHPNFWPVLPLTFIVRGVSAYVISERVLKAKLSWVLLPVEDLATFFFWIAGFFGSTIVWRGRRYRLHRDGRFELLPPIGQ
jgi:ceramide glucosyltransferase